MEETENGQDALVKLGRQILTVLDSDAITVTLENGDVVEGSPTGFSLKKKTRKGESSWNGSFSVETSSGVLEMDISTVASVEEK